MTKCLLFHCTSSLDWAPKSLFAINYQIQLHVYIVYFKKYRVNLPFYRDHYERFVFFWWSECCRKLIFDCNALWSPLVLSSYPLFCLFIWYKASVALWPSGPVALWPYCPTHSILSCGFIALSFDENDLFYPSLDHLEHIWIFTIYHIHSYIRSTF